MEARKMGDQKRLTCQKHKLKERNVANNDENIFVFHSNSMKLGEILVH